LAAASNYVKWDASAGTLTIAGEGSGITNIDGGNIQTNTVTATQLSVSTLSAITANMGTLSAGRIELGTGTVGTNFTGLVLDASGVTYDSEAWHLAGLNNETLEVGINAGDGKLYAGDGAVILDASGQLVTTSGNADAYIKFFNTTVSSTYADHFAFLNLQATDPNGDPYGIFNVGLRHNSNNQSGIACWLGEVDVAIESGGNWRYVLQASYNRVYVEGVPLRLPQLSSAPSSPAYGDMYFNTSNHYAYVYTNRGWERLN